MEPTFAIPSQLQYDTATPSSLGARVEQSVVTPITGQLAVYVQAGNYFMINVPQTGNDCVLSRPNEFLPQIQIKFGQFYCSC